MEQPEWKPSLTSFLICSKHFPVTQLHGPLFSEAGVNQRAPALLMGIPSLSQRDIPIFWASFRLPLFVFQSWELQKVALGSNTSDLEALARKVGGAC